DGRARVVDPPSPVEQVSMSELLALTDGIGVMVQKRGSPQPIFWTAWLEQAIQVGFMLGALTLVRAMLPARLAPLARGGAAWRSAIRLARAAGLLGVGPAVAVAWHFASGRGFLRNPGAPGFVGGPSLDPVR